MSGLAGHLDSPVDSRGRLVLVSPLPQTYRMVYRSTSRPYGISTAFSSSAKKVLFDFQHVTPSFRDVTIRHVWFGLENDLGDPHFYFDFVHKTKPTVFGQLSRAIVNPVAVASNGRNFSECIGNVYDPNASPVYANENFVYSTTEFMTNGATPSAPTNNPPNSLAWIDLLGRGYSLDNEETLPLSPRTISPSAFATVSGGHSPGRGTANDSWEVNIINDSGGDTIIWMAVIEFTEE